MASFFDPAALVQEKNKKITDWSCGYIPLCHHYIHSLVSSLPSPVHLLDSGCGNGQFLKYLGGTFNDTLTLWGCDISDAHLKEAQKLHNGPTYKLASRATEGALPFKSNTMDIVTCNFVVSCIEDNDELEAYFKEIKRVLKEQMSAFLVLINNPEEIVDTRFVGLQIGSDTKTPPKPMDKVTIKFFESESAVEPYWSSPEVWRPVDMMKEMLHNIFSEKSWNVTTRNLKHEDYFDVHVQRLDMNPELLLNERIKCPFTLFIVESNGLYTDYQQRMECLRIGFIRKYCEKVMQCPKVIDAMSHFIACDFEDSKNEFTDNER